MSTKYRIRKIINITIFTIAVAKFYKCPVKFLFGIDCPSCGMTRAFLALMNFDLHLAFSYHPLFPVFGILFFYGVYRLVFPDKKHLSNFIELVICIISLLLLLIVWLVRQFT